MTTETKTTETKTHHIVLAGDVMVDQVGQPEKEKGSNRNDEPKFHEVAPHSHNVDKPGCDDEKGESYGTIESPSAAYHARETSRMMGQSRYQCRNRPR